MDLEEATIEQIANEIANRADCDAYRDQELLSLADYITFLVEERYDAN